MKQLRTTQGQPRRLPSCAATDEAPGRPPWLRCRDTRPALPAQRRVESTETLVDLEPLVDLQRLEDLERLES